MNERWASAEFFQAQAVRKCFRLLCSKYWANLPLSMHQNHQYSSKGSHHSEKYVPPVSVPRPMSSAGAAMEGECHPQVQLNGAYEMHCSRLLRKAEAEQRVCRSEPRSSCNWCGKPPASMVLAGEAEQEEEEAWV